MLKGKETSFSFLQGGLKAYNHYNAEDLILRQEANYLFPWMLENH